MYQLTEIEKHNLETLILRCTSQIMHLETLLEKATGNTELQGTTNITLEQLQNAQRTLDNLTPFVSEWQDRESDVHNTL